MGQGGFDTILVVFRPTWRYSKPAR